MAGKTMKAIRMHEYGDPGVLKYEDVPVPEIAPDEVLVKIDYASVNPFDWKVRAGMVKGFTLPLTLGIDLSGKVEKVGSKVSGFKIGDLVFGKADFKKSGSYAQYAPVKESSLAHLPKAVSQKEAAALPTVVGTAWTALFDVAKLKAGQTILITGASGGVGSAAVQLAKNAGARVIGTTSTKNIDMVRSLGADEVIDYTAGDYTKKTKPVDVIFDTVGGETLAKAYSAVKKGGILVTSAGMPDDALAKKQCITATGFQGTADGKRLEEIAKLVEAGKLQAVIDREFNLAETAAAHELSQSGKAKGKIMIKVS